MSDVITAIEARASAIYLADPAPTPAQLATILRAGTRSPDHGRLSPWRFTLIDGKARVRLGQEMARCLAARNPDATGAQLEQERAKALRAPLIIVAGARITKPSKVPEIEQVMAVAAGVQNMILAAQQLGYGAMWKTGGIAYDDEMKRLVGLAPSDHIVGLIYIGTTAKLPPPRQVELGLLINRL